MSERKRLAKCELKIKRCLLKSGHRVVESYVVRRAISESVPLMLQSLTFIKRNVNADKHTHTGAHAHTHTHTNSAIRPWRSSLRVSR